VPLAKNKTSSTKTSTSKSSRSKTSEMKTSTLKRGKLRIKGHAMFIVGEDSLVAEQEHRVRDAFYANSRLKLDFDDHPESKRSFILDPLKGRGDGGVYTEIYRDDQKQRWKVELRRGED